MKFTIIVSLPYICNILNFGPVVLENKMLRHNDGSQVIAIGTGNLSDSGDLIIVGTLENMRG